MGMVYRARQISLDREVALKVLPSVGLDPESVARFQREAEAAGRLSHPGIVPVYGVGSTDGIHYYAMELVEGPSLYILLDSLRDSSPAELRQTLMEETAMAAVFPSLREQPMPGFLTAALYPASCAALAAEVAGALHVAHQGKVIHRDVKPSNILIHPAGRPVLVDFGLARDELSFSMTQTGDAVGTPSYMAPEQAAGSKHVDARVDVYGLGATLYEMLTLRPPFEGSHSGEIMQAILEEDPVSPRRINPRVPRTLETIVLSCLAKEPDSRYSSTADLQRDLRGFLSGGSIRARRPGVLEIVGRRIKRNRSTAYAGLLSVMLALLVGLMVGLVDLNNDQQQGRLALENAKILLLEGDARGAHAAYDQALILLEDDKRVADARLESFSEVFEVMYGKAQYGPLDEFLANLHGDDVDRPEYHAFHRRLRGMGSIEVLADSDVEVWLRGIEGEEFEAQWRRLPRDGWLSLGQYLLRLESPEMAPLIRAVEVERDRRLVLEPQFTPTSLVPEGSCLVASPEGAGVFAVDRMELTLGRYVELLASIEDRELAAELRPSMWPPESPLTSPVTGLSYRQARTAVALLGGHLLTARDYRYAATGGLDELSYPWGRKFDIARVVGDPRYTSALAPANTKPEGASPNGILNLVGNAAELLSRTRDGRFLVAGGHYGSQPRDLTVFGTSELGDADEQQATTGMRVARFLPEPDDPEAQERYTAHVRRVESNRQPHTTTIWRIQDSGKVDVHQAIQLPATEGNALVSTPVGFRQGVEFSVRGPAGDSLRWTKSGGGTRGVQYLVQLPSAPDLLQIEIDRELEPTTGLYGTGDTYLMHLPAAPGQSVDRVELPSGSRVEEVWPRPDESFYRAGRQVLVWYRRGSTDALVSFQRDGALTDRWPVRQRVEAAIREFFAGLEASDVDQIARTLSQDARLLPHGWDRGEVLRKVKSVGVFSNPRVWDAMAVGDMIAVELEVDLRPATGIRGEEPVNDWPMAVLLRRSGEDFEVVRVMPAIRRDTGSIEGGRYEHPELRVEVGAIDSVAVSRLARGTTQMQVELRPVRASEDFGVTLVGTLAGEDEDARTIRRRLTGGKEFWSRGERVTGSRVPRLVTESANRPTGTTEHWLFRSRDGARWSRESWDIVRLGQRHLLLRSVAVGSTRVEAQRLFREQGEWFRTVSDALVIR